MKPGDIFFEHLIDKEEEQYLSTIAQNRQESKDNVSCAVRTSTPSEKTQSHRVCQKNKRQQKPPTDWHSKLLEYGGLLTILFSVFMLISLIQRDSGSKIPQAQAAVAPVATPEPPKPEICRKKISEIHIGEKSVGHNPQGIEASESDSEIFQKVKHNGYTLLYLKKNQTLSVIELLRPENWLESENIQIRRGSDDKVLEDSELEQFDLAKEFNRDDEDYDLEVWIELPEMGVVGWSTLVAIDDQVKIQDGPGNVVTGTFAHISDNVIDLQIEGQDKTIGCTGNHPFWSADRQEFIEAGQLLEGEQVLLYSGETKRVVQKLPRPGPQVVYNLEVYAEHVYHVTQDGVLVHNNCNSKILGDNMVASGVKRRAKMAAHHIVAARSKKAKAAQEVLERAKIDLNDARNGIFLTYKKHRHIHTNKYFDKINNILIQAEKDNKDIAATLKDIATKIRKGKL